MKSRKTFLEWLDGREHGDLQRLAALKLDEASHFIIKRMQLSSGKSWLLNEFDKYLTEMVQVEENEKD